MNFLNRRMFQEGGDANQEYIIGTDKSINYYDPATFEQQLRSLSESEIFALQNSANSRQISLTPGLQSILNQVISGKETPIYKEGIFDINTEYGSPLVTRDPPINKSSYSSIAGDYGRAAKGIYGPILSALVRNMLSEEQLQNAGRIGIPGFGGTSFKAIAEYDSPFFGEGFKGFEEAGARGGRTREELDAILSGGLQPIPGQEIQDLQLEVDAIGEPSVVDSPNLNLIEDLDEVGEPDTARTFSPIDQEGKTLSFSGSAPEMEAKRLAYEKSLIGVDEFGFPIERPGAINQRPTRPLSITDFSDELKDLKPVNVLKTEIESKEEMQEKFLPDLKPTLINVDTSITQKEADAINKKDQKERDDPVTTISNKPGFFGSDNFLNFIRNVGGELVRTGQFGEGLASGAAKAAEERAARELIADQEERKYSKEMELAIAKARATYKPDTMTIDKTAEYNEKVKKDITDFEGGLAGVGFVDYAIEIIEEAQAAGEAVGGFEGLMAKLVDKGLALAGMGREFDNLSADSKVAALTKVVKQKNLQAILGESGRTISDKDREIIERVFGDLSAFEEPSTTLGLLRESRRGLAAANAERYSRLTSNAELISRQGPEGARFYQQLLPSLQRILGIDPYGNQAAIARARFAGRDPNAGIPEISLGG
jgi:hypothetical protein